MWNINLDNLLPYAFVLVIVFPFLVLTRQFVYRFINLKNKELSLLAKNVNTHSSLQIKLQAYERMIIFLERLKPSNFINKFDKDLTAKEFVFLLDKSIKEEFDYNISQQLYISEHSWGNIIQSKNNILHLIHHKMQESNSDISLQEFKTLLLMNYLNGEDYIADSIQNLKIDIQHLIK